MSEPAHQPRRVSVARTVAVTHPRRRRFDHLHQPHPTDTDLDRWLVGGAFPVASVIIAAFVFAAPFLRGAL